MKDNHLTVYFPNVRKDNTISNQAERNSFMDIVKYATIFLVIWGHVVQQTCMLSNAFYDPIYNIIYTFHMPLFMCICGFFFSKSIARYSTYGNVKAYIRNKLPVRLKSLLFPMITFCILKLFLQFFIDGKPVSVLDFFVSLHGIWFLGDLAINSVIVAIAKCFCNGNFKHDWKVFLFSLPFSAIPKLGYGVLGLFMYIFFVAGFWINDYYKGEIYSLTKYWIYVLFAYILVFCLISFLPYEPSSFMWNFRKYPISQILIVDITKLILGFCGTYLTFFFVYKMTEFISSTWLEARAIIEGKYTLEIYLLNIIIIEKLGGYYTYMFLIIQEIIFFTIVDYCSRLFRHSFVPVLCSK